MRKMMSESERSERSVIEKAADAIRWASENGGWADMARAALAVFRKHTAPTGDEREELERIISDAESATDDEGEWALPEDVADAILARFRLAPRGEPTRGTEGDDREYLVMALYAAGMADSVHERVRRFTVEAWADAILAAGFRRGAPAEPAETDESKKRAELAERLRQIAESQRMDFDSPHVGMTLDEAADALTAVSAERDAAIREMHACEVTDLMIDAALDAWFVDTLGDPRTPAWLVSSVKDGHWERMRGALTAAMEAEG